MRADEVSHHPWIPIVVARRHSLRDALSLSNLVFDGKLTSS